MLLKHIFLGFGISFIGSLPIGALNLTAIEVAVKHRFFQVILFGLGVILVEYLQAGIAIYFSEKLLSNPSIERVIEIAVIPIFLIIGFIYIFSSKTKENDKEQISKKTNSITDMAPFKKGIFLSIINPLAIPFWLAVCTSFNAAGQLIYEWNYIQAFLLGLILGTFLALILYGGLGEILEKRLQKYEHWFSPIIGITLITIAIIQIFRVFF